MFTTGKEIGSYIEGKKGEKITKTEKEMLFNSFFDKTFKKNTLTEFSSIFFALRIF